MINFQGIKRIVILGGGTAGWYAALALKKIFSPNVEIRVIESEKIGIVGVGEGGLLNFISALRFVDIDPDEFKQATNATFKWGFSYEGWRTGKADDVFYHPFGSASGVAAKWHENGHYPLFSLMINQGIQLDSYIRGMHYIKNNVTQEEAHNAILSDSTDIINSFHFDSYKTAKYLKNKALERGVTHQDVVIESVIRDQEGTVTHLITDTKESIALDFIIDASGLARKIISTSKEADWESFTDYLILDRAIPFYMPHPKKNPMLVSRAIAMSSGWMWQIPLQDRVGAGYVYSSRHLSDEAAVAEVKNYLGFDVEIQKNIKFESGCYKRVWIKNMLTIGLASGFVEPLEATSISQMVEEVRNFTRVIAFSQGIVSSKTIAEFNEANLRSWHGIRDFLRMHYDVPRRDTAFWRDAAQAKYPDTYFSFKEIVSLRAPRLLDIENYAINGWYGIFHIINWTFVAAALGLIPPQAVVNDLLAIPDDKKARLEKFLEWIDKKKTINKII